MIPNWCFYGVVDRPKGSNHVQLEGGAPYLKVAKERESILNPSNAQFREDLYLTLGHPMPLWSSNLKQSKLFPVGTIASPNIH